MTPKLAQIIDLFPGHIYWKNKEGIYLDCNDEQALVLGLSSRGDIIGKTDQELSWRDHADELRKIDQQVMDFGQPIIVEEKLRLADGREMVVISKKVPWRNDAGEIEGVIGTSVDISELKKKEAELILAKEKSEAANIAKSNFLAMMSHEFRTPLNGILGMLEILRYKADKDFFQEYLSPVENSANHLLHLVNDLLLFSNLEIGSIKVQRKVFSLRSLFDEMASTFYPKILQNSIQFKTQYDDTLPERIYGDPLRLKQIIINLIENAFKYTPAGSLSLSFSKDQDELRVEVADTGLGIAPEMQDKIFDRFTQVDSSYTRKIGGVGLGLAICKELILKMQGKIGLESELNKGSLFWFTVPIEEAFELPEAEQEAKNQESAHSSKRILLVEDNQINQRVAQALLEQLACQVDVAATGAEALAFYQKNHYDLILMDIGLPDMDGMSVAKKIRERDANVRIVALTAYAFGKEAQEFLASGMNDVLVKPISLEKLHNILRLG